MNSPPYPHFLIVGFTKAATTTIFDKLVKHPDVVEPIEKELHYFTREHVPFYNEALRDMSYADQLRLEESEA